jgi:molybdopterin-containing oxidoreductase family membrane subunit
MHSTIATLLAVSVVPGWHATVFPPYFVSGAIFGGLAMALLLLIPLRTAFKLEAYITIDHLERLAKIMLAVGMIVLHVYLVEFFFAWYSESPSERGQYWYRLFGEHNLFFWVMILCNVVILQLLWFKSLRRNLAVLTLVGVAVNVGMWLERYNIIVLSLERDHLPSKWTAYAFTGWDYMLLAGSFGLFFTQFLLFCRLIPMVSIAEIKATLLNRHRQGANHG